MSRSTARHRRTSHSHRPVASRHRKPSALTTAVQPARLAAAAVAGTTLIAGGAAPTIMHAIAAQAPTPPDRGAQLVVPGSGVSLSKSTSGFSDVRLAAARAAARLRRESQDVTFGRPTTTRPSARTGRPTATTAAYLNPLRSVTDLVPERIDMGVDFAGAGPVYALGDGVVTSATDDSSGWPGGGWITYRLTDGPDVGLIVYLAEDVTSTVQVGQQVTPDTVIGNMYNGGDGIETGWAQPDSESAESQLPAAGSISGGGPFPTEVGLNFEELLQALGVPAALNRSAAPFGLLPAGYPTSWPGI